VEFDGDITGIARAGDAVMVYIGNGNPYIVTGNKEDNNLAKIQLPTTQGCPNFRTIAYSGHLMWQSIEGVCALIKQPLGRDPRIEVLSRGKFNFPGIANFALAQDDKYHLFFDDEVIVFDLHRDLFYSQSITAEYGFVSNITGIMYLVENALFFDFKGGITLEQQYRSPKIHARLPTRLKNFKVLKIKAEKDVKVSLFHDDVQVREDVVFNPVEARSFKIPGGDIYDLEIELKSEGIITSVAVTYDLVKEA